MSDNNLLSNFTPAACLLFGQENTVLSLQKTNFSVFTKAIYQHLISTQGNSASCLFVNSVHSLPYFTCGHHKWLMTSCIEVACQQLYWKSRSAAARNPVASVKRLCTLSEPLCMKRTLQRLSIRPNTLRVTLENIYKSLPTVTVIAGPNPVHCRCGWCASKTHKPTHIPERASLPCLHKTIMSEIFLCSLNT